MLETIGEFMKDAFVFVFSENAIGTAALLLAGITYFKQNHVEEIVMYTEEKDGDFFIVVENIGTKTAHNYFLELDQSKSKILGYLKDLIIEMPVFHKAEGFTLPPNKSIRFSIGDHISSALETVTITKNETQTTPEPETQEGQGENEEEEEKEFTIQKDIQMTYLVIDVFKEKKNKKFKWKGTFELNYNIYQGIMLYYSNTRKMSHSLKKIEREANKMRRNEERKTRRGR